MFKWFTDLFDLSDRKESTNWESYAGTDKAPAPEPVYLHTSKRNYTATEYEDILQYIRVYATNSFIRVKIGDIHYDNRKPELVGTIISSYSDFYSSTPRIRIDLSTYEWSYWLNILETLKSINPKDLHGNDPLISDRGGFELRTYYEYTENRTNNILNNLSNFSNDTNASKELIKLVNGAWDRQSSVCAYIPLNSSIDEIHNIIKKFIIDKEETFNKNVSTYITNIDKILVHFPDSMYMVVIEDGNKVERLLTTTIPVQDASSCYKIENVLFRDGFFALIPPVMYKITVKPLKKSDIANSFINLIHANFKSYVSKHFEATKE